MIFRLVRARHGFQRKSGAWTQQERSCAYQKRGTPYDNWGCELLGIGSIHLSVVVSFLHSLRLLVRSRAALHVEILALRHQLAIANRSRRPRLPFTTVDRVLWAWLSRAWTLGGRRFTSSSRRPSSPWHRRGFRLFWTWKSRHRTGRPTIAYDAARWSWDVRDETPFCPIPARAIWPTRLGDDRPAHCQNVARSSEAALPTANLYELANTPPAWPDAHRTLARTQRPLCQLLDAGAVTFLGRRTGAPRQHDFG